MSPRAGLQRLSRILFLHQSGLATTTTTAARAPSPLLPGRATTRGSSTRSRLLPTWRGFAAGGSTPAGSSVGASGGAPPPLPPRALSQFDRWRAALSSAPPVALALGALGVLPFIALSPPVVKHIAWLLPYAVTERHDIFQVGYGVAISSFLGGVHWGCALSSPLTAAAGPVAARMATERLVWGVVPSLLAWPLVAMEAAPASAMLAVLLPAFYLVDGRFARRGLLPAWYFALRAPLTLGATFGCLLTASHHVHQEADRVAAAAGAAERAAAAAKEAGEAAAAPGK
jgi:hypothetical protein